MTRYSTFGDYYKPMFPRLLELIEIEGLKQDTTAEILSSEGFVTERGGKITQSTVSRALAVARHQRRVELAKQKELAETNN